MLVLAICCRSECLSHWKSQYVYRHFCPKNNTVVLKLTVSSLQKTPTPTFPPSFAPSMKKLTASLLQRHLLVHISLVGSRRLYYRLERNSHSFLVFTMCDLHHHTWSCRRAKQSQDFYYAELLDRFDVDLQKNFFIWRELFAISLWQHTGSHFAVAMGKLFELGERIYRFFFVVS